MAKEIYQRKTPSSFPTIKPQKAEGLAKFTEFSIIIESPAVVHHNHQYGFDIKKVMPILSISTRIEYQDPKIWNQYREYVGI